MQALSRGQKGAAKKVVWYLFECTRGSKFEITLDDQCVRDIADVMLAEYPKELESSCSEFDHQGQSMRDDYSNQHKVCFIDKDLKLSKAEKQSLKERQLSQKYAVYR